MADAPGCVRFFFADFRKLCRGATQFLLTETRRPVSVCPTNYTLFAQHLEHYFKIQHGTTFPNTAHLNNIVLKSNLVTHRSGTSDFCKAEIAPLPYRVFGIVYCVAKSLCSLRWLLYLFSYVIPHLNAAFHCILYLVACCCLFCHFILRFCAILLLFLAVLTLKTLSLAPFLFKLYFLYLSNENLQNRIV